jgi:DNA-binding MarR family transcriptional regulator
MADSSRGDELSRRAEEASRTIAQSCLGWRVRMLNRLVTALYDDALRPLGLTGAQLSILSCLHLLPRKRPVEIGHVLKIDKSTLSRNLDRMQRNGWIAKARGRGELALTREGSRLVGEALPLWREAQKQCEQAMGEPGAAGVLDLAEHMAPVPAV